MLFVLGVLVPILHVLGLVVILVKKRTNVAKKMSFVPNAVSIVAMMLPPDFVHDKIGYWRALDLALGAMMSSTCFFVMVTMSLLVSADPQYDPNDRLTLLAPFGVGLVIPLYFGYDFLFPFR